MLRQCPVCLFSEAGTRKKVSPRSPGPPAPQENNSVCDTPTVEGRESDSDAGRQAVDQRLWSSQCGFENSKEGVLGPEDTQGSQEERAAGLTHV